MRGRIIGAGLGLIALGLAGCNQTGEPAANKGLCYDFKSARTANAANPLTAPAANLPATTAAAPAANAAADESAQIDDCLRRWAYSLAPGRDNAEIVAGAAVAACGGVLARWNEQALGQGGGGEQAPSITTGQPTTPLEAHAAFARDRALLYVVQARAGRCAAPPTANGAPQGVIG